MVEPILRGLNTLKLDPAKHKHAHGALETLRKKDGAFIFAIDDVIATQKLKLRKLHNAGLIGEEQKDLIDTSLEALKHHECGICGLPGHAKSYCWLNQQMWADARRNPNLEMAHHMWREGIKAKALFKREAAKLASKQHLAAEKLKVNLSHKLANMKRKRDVKTDAKYLAQAAAGLRSYDPSAYHFR